MSSLRSAAARAGTDDPDMFAGPSSVTPDGVLLLALSKRGRILDAVLALADALRPSGTTFCVATGRGASTDEPGPASHMESALLSAEEAATAALRGIELTDAKEQRIHLLVPEADTVAGALAGMVLASYDAMTPRQRQIIALTKGSDTQQQVATHLDVTRQAVNQSLAAAGWPHLRRAEEALQGRLAPEPDGGSQA